MLCDVLKIFHVFTYRVLKYNSAVAVEELLL